MTRINLIPPSKLADQHLFSEWREIKHIPAALMRKLNSTTIAGVLKVIPSEFTLNTGHITFFMDKMDFLSNRYYDLTAELDARRTHTYSEESHQKFYDWIAKVPNEFFMKKYVPPEKAIRTSVERILLRISEKDAWYRYQGEVKNLEFFEALTKEYK